MSVLWQSSDEITAKEYGSLEQDNFRECKKGTAKFLWKRFESKEEIEALTESDLTQLLETSYVGFNLNME